MAKKVQNKNNITDLNDDFIMSPKVDFVFKLIFGDEKNKKILISLLSSILNLNIDEFESIELLNTELLKQFQEDKKGILDVRVKTKHGKVIDIEIQILPTDFMAERSLFYWSKMYTGQITSGDTYDKLKKCIAINIIDFIRIPIDKFHTTFHLFEDETKHKLTDVLEIHYLELPKLQNISKLTDGNDPSLYWLEFINAKSKEEMELLAKKNENIQLAFDILQRVSKSKSARLAYEARQAEIMDQLTREKVASEKGRAEGIATGIAAGEAKKAIAIAENMIEIGLDNDIISKTTGLSLEEVKEIRKNIK